jgi:hypothetical protein
MGIVYPGVPQKLALWLRDKTAATHFIETGTYLANTALWAAHHFDRVISIEAEPNLYDRARKRLASCTNVDLRLGRSQDILAGLVGNLSHPALMWLDAHWCGGDIAVAGEDDQCPLLEEIAAIDKGITQHLILIDDARYFLNRPPPPNKHEQWPSADAVMKQLRAKYDSYICVMDDVIIRIPIALQESFEAVLNKRDQLEEAESQLEEMRAKLNQRTSEANELRQARAELNHRTSMLEAQVLALTSSSSWGLTELLQWLAGKGAPCRRNLRRAVKAAWWAMTPWHIPARIRLIRERKVASKAAYPHEPRVAAGNVGQLQHRLHLDTLPDGEFIVALAEFLFQGRGALPEDVEKWKNVLADGRATRIDLLRGAADAFLGNRRRGERLENDPTCCWIMGTDRRLVRSDWENKARELGLSTPATPPSDAKAKPQPFQHSGEYVVSAIASLYKGGRYIEHFLENITTQSIFDRTELIIVDANSPEGEDQIIAQYQKNFPNIIYKRINYRLGIYDAWNVGVEMSRGRYLTNTNVDDLRRRDSFELQAETLDRYDFIDVVYQDFFYSFDDSLVFEEVEKFGFKSDLPIVTPHNLLKFNSPHNAPMWRKSLHAELGPFDTSYRSAGDWEFWMRCLSNGKNFLKINTPHIAYFHNPRGVSTRPGTRGLEEGCRILRSYSDKLISRELRLSRQGLAEVLGTQADWDATTSYYDVVQRELSRLGARFRENRS